MKRNKYVVEYDKERKRFVKEYDKKCIKFVKKYKKECNKFVEEYNKVCTKFVKEYDMEHSNWVQRLQEDNQGVQQEQQVVQRLDAADVLPKPREISCHRRQLRRRQKKGGKRANDNLGRSRT